MQYNSAYNLSQYLPIYQPPQAYQPTTDYNQQPYSYTQRTYNPHSNPSIGGYSAYWLISTLMVMLSQYLGGAMGGYGSNYNSGYNNNYNDPYQGYDQPQYNDNSDYSYDYPTYGEPGPQGPKGDKGDRGYTGPQGPKGDKGDKGVKGDRGYDGKDGKDGAQGPKGDKGDRGYTGPQGPKGDKGDKGVKGDRGYDGKDGKDGKDGAQGPKGDKGDRGYTGPQGPKGDKGDKGDKGEKGDPGVCLCDDHRIHGSAYLAGDPKLGLTTPELRALNTALNDYNSNMVAGETYTLLQDADANGFKVDVKAFDINGSQGGGIAVENSVIKAGNHTIEVSSGSDAVATVKDANGNVTNTVKLSDGLSQLDLGNGVEVDVESVVDSSAGNLAKRIVVKNSEYSVSYALRNPGNNLPTYLDMGFAERTDDAASNATGYQAQVDNLQNPVTGNGLKLGIADLLNLEEDSPLIQWLKI